MRRLLFPLLLVLLTSGCSNCDDESTQAPDAGGFVEEDTDPPDVWNPGDDTGDGCNQGSGGGTSGGGTSGGSSGGCDETPVDCSQIDCVHGTCQPGSGAQPDRCDCEEGWAGPLCNTCDTGFVPQGSECVACADELCGHGTCRPQPADSTCACEPGYTGDLCDACAEGYRFEGDACVPDDDPPGPCTPNPCSEPNRTRCTPDGDAFVCGCDEGYQEDAGQCVPGCDVDPALCQAAARSFDVMVSANGHGAIGYNVEEGKAYAFQEHIYRNWDEGVWTRDLLFDSYLGVRTGDQRVWLNTVPARRASYASETGIIHVIHQPVGGLQVETFLYAPWELSRPALVLMGKVTNVGQQPVEASIYSLHNYHVGFTSEEDPVNPDARGERIQYQPQTGAWVETGVGGALIHMPIGDVDHHGASPENPYQALLDGQDLADNQDSGEGDDRVAGFQKDLSLAPGESGWIGVVTAFESDSGLVQAMGQEVAAAYEGAGPEQALSGALDGWEAWRKPAPEGLSPAERAVYRQSEAILRQGQIWETSDRSLGQIVASLPPGMWNICWMRDMAYAISALVRSGHHNEARAALEFVLLADAGHYEDDYVGTPYQVTITRYFGRGKEETDFNENGPNIEFDGFGMFLWVLGEYVGASGDMGLVEDHWDTIKVRIADALINLTDPGTGMILPDSSIWEVHWNGQQKRYTYTSLAAARGLCDMAALAERRGDQALAQTYLEAGQGIRDAIKARATDDSGALAASLEELRDGLGYYDMASVEGMNWMLFEPAGATGAATFDLFENNLRVASGRGFFRNDDGGWYDSQEWVVADLRTALAYDHAGRPEASGALLDWITAQGLSNFGMIAELHHPDSSIYEGEVPMVGFGAGAYMLGLWNRAMPEAVEPACGTWE